MTIFGRLLRMRKIVVVELAVFVISANAFSIVIEARGQYFSPSEKSFKDIYGGGWKYGGEIGFSITRHLDFWVSGNNFSKKGKLTFTQEESKLSILSAGGGLRYRLTTGAISGYTAAGANYYRFKESNPIGDVRKGGVGFEGRAGVLIKIVRGLLVDLNIGYSYCKMKPADFDINIGGIEAGVGLAVDF